MNTTVSPTNPSQRATYSNLLRHTYSICCLSIRLGMYLQLGRLQLLSCAREGGAVELWERRTDGGFGLWRENWEWRWAKNQVWERSNFFCIMGFMNIGCYRKKKIRIFVCFFFLMMLTWKIVVLAKVSVIYIYIYIYILVKLVRW